MRAILSDLAWARTTAGAAIVALAPASRLRRSIHPVLAVISSLPGRAPQFERR